MMSLAESKSKDMLMRDFYEMAGEEISHNKNISSLLRRFKKREYIRIGLRDLLGRADLVETVRDISNLADVCLQIAYEKANMDLKNKYGIPYYEDENGDWKISEFTKKFLSHRF